MSTRAEEAWIGVGDVAAEMRYTERQAWEYLRSIGLASTNARSMKLARFTRADFEAARDRSKAPIAPRSRAAGPAPRPASAPGPAADAIESIRERLRRG